MGDLCDDTDTAKLSVSKTHAQSQNCLVLPCLRLSEFKSNIEKLYSPHCRSHALNC